MSSFLQIFLIATIPSAFTAILSFWASWIASKVQIQAIKEQNKADIEKLIEQNKADIEKLIEQNKADIEKMKEQYKIQADMEEKSHANQLEIMKINNEMEMKKCLENTIGKFVLLMVDSVLGDKKPIGEDDTDVKAE